MAEQVQTLPWEDTLSAVTPSAPSPVEKVETLPWEDSAHTPPAPDVNRPEAVAALPWEGPTTSTTPTTTNFEKQKKEIENTPFYGHVGSGVETTPEDLRAISEKYGVSATKLAEVAPYLGAYYSGNMWDPETIAKRGIGLVGEGPLAGLPQKAYILMQEPQMQAALDHLRQLSDVRKNLLVRGAELVAPGGAIVSTSKKILPRLAAAAATGALQGVGHSETGDEFKQAVIGAALMGGATGVLHGVGSGARKVIRFFNPEMERELDDVVSRNVMDLGRKSEEIRSSRAVTEDTLREVVRGDTRVDKLDPEKLVSIAEEIPEKLLSRKLDPETSIGRVVAERVWGDAEKAAEMRASDPQEYERGIKEYLGRGQLASRLDNFAKDTGISKTEGKTTLASLDKDIANWREGVGGGAIGPDRALDKLENWMEARGSIDWLAESRLRSRDPIWRPLRVAQQFISDFQDVALGADERLGTSLTPALREAESALNRHTLLREVTNKWRGELVDISRKAGLKEDDISRLLEAPQAEIARLDPLKQEAIKTWRYRLTDAPDSLRNLLIKGDPEAGIRGIPIRELAGYVTHKVVEPPKFVAIMSNIADRVQTQVGVRLDTLDQQTYTKLVENPTPEMSALLEGLGWLRGGKSPADVRVFTAALDDATHLNSVRQSLATKSAASYERTGHIPEFLRERNILKIWDSYVSGNFRHMFLSNSMDKMRTQIPVLRKAGDEVTATRIENWIADMVGTRVNTPAALPRMVSESIKAKAYTLAGQTDNPVAQVLLSTMARSPDMIAGIFNTIYPNFLGYNVRAVVRNATQVPAMVGSQLGGGYGGLTSIKALAEASHPANAALLEKKIVRWGLAPALHMGDAVMSLERGMAETALVAAPKWLIKKNAEISMAAYQWTDGLNRRATVAVASHVIDDFMAGGSKAASAERALLRQPTQVRRAVVEAVRRGDQEEAERILSIHLVATTQFHYNKAAMSEFGRTMGPLFSTFSKWPAAVAGDIMHKLETEGAVKGSAIAARKYFAPLMMAAAVQHLVFGAPQDMTDSEKFWIGSNGLAEWVPGYSVAGTAGLLRPAFFDSLGPLLMAPVSYSVHGDSDKLHTDVMRGINKAGQAFMPGAGALRFLMRDIPTMTTGTRPDYKLFED